VSGGGNAFALLFHVMVATQFRCVYILLVCTNDPSRDGSLKMPIDDQMDEVLSTLCPIYRGAVPILAGTYDDDR
jgi:hypothetical protein